ncbi:Na+/H+ antiporter NhaC [Lysobacteraceae bacterium NML120232]|nr:Na+/H+ antiporter NhaC [Xanthomonadaceae bacterium NML120232]
MTEKTTPVAERAPKLWQALLPLLFLATLLGTSVMLFGDNSSAGPNQIALMLSAMVAALIGLANGKRWQEIQNGMVHGISLAIVPILILLAVGALIGAWMLSGTVPTLIVYGLKLMHPSYFYPAACLVCAIVALAIGSSWTVAGTLGVALIGVAQGLGMSPAITAGAVISGAYFGDKISPLSETTNLAPAAVDSELFAHIRHMLWTTVPSLALALVLFTVVGLSSQANSSEVSFGELPSILQAHFNIGPHLLIPLVVVVVLAVKKMPAYPAILIGALTGLVFAALFQTEAMRQMGQAEGRADWLAMLAGGWKVMADGFSIETGNAAADELVSRGGMASMLSTIWLIVCAMGFGAVMEHTGLLERLIRMVLKLARSVGSLVAATIATAFGINVVSADQYMSIVLTGRLYREEYERRGLAPVNLSRALEDGGTLTSPLVPWNTCGAYMAVTLGVATLDYLPYVFFNLLNPLIAIAMAYGGFKILYLPPGAATGASSTDRQP